MSCSGIICQICNFMLLPRVKSQKRTDHNVTGPGGNLKREESIRSLIIYTFFLFDLVEYHLLNFLLLKILQWHSWNNYIGLRSFNSWCAIGHSVPPGGNLKREENIIL